MGQKETIGTGVGAVLGGVAGSFIGKGAGKVVATVAGVAVGGYLGNRIGAMLDEEDQKALQAQAQQALLTQPDNGPVTWTSNHTDATAVVVPENSRVETREVKIVRDANVAPAPQLDLIGAKYVVKTRVAVRLNPSEDADTATTLAAGATIWAVGKVRGQSWIMVAKGGKSIGYAPASTLGPAPRPVQTAVAKPAAAPPPAPLDLDAAAPVRTPTDLDALGPNEKADTLVASVACRDVKTTATTRGQTETATQTACKSPDGSWNLE
jgi:surface antigen